MEKKASSFSGQIGFVLAAAGSAVGVGNLWRFPYLAAKDGGGLFLLVYLVLVLTFGFTLLTSDIAIGRRTKQSAIRAYETMRPKWKFLGILTFLVPVLIMTYYAVIGGWITKYAVVYLTGQAAAIENARRQALAAVNDLMRAYKMLDLKLNDTLLNNIMILGLQHAVYPLEQDVDTEKWEIP